jgi:hypothetical protein
MFGHEMNTVKQNSYHPWVAVFLIISIIVTIIMLIVGYYKWPPELSMGWIIGSFTGFVFFISGVRALARIWYIAPLEFELTDSEIIIRDMGFLKPRVRKFSANLVTNFVYSSENGSYIKTSDGKNHYLDQILMLKRDDIIEMIEQHFNHIKTERY